MPNTITMTEIPKYSAYYTVWRGTLYMTPTSYADDPFFDDTCEVTAPYSQEFLDEINEVLGTSFQMSQFAGR